MKGYEVVVETLRRRGVEVMFGLMGNGNLKIVHGWANDLGRRYVAAWHEAQAVAMARGYAKASGQPAVVTVTHGPGVTNTVTALTACVRGRTPMVLIAGDTVKGLPGRLQDIDQAAVLAPTGARLLQVDDVQALPVLVDDALDIAVASQCPVVLNLPIDVQEAAVTTLQQRSVGAPRPGSAALPRPAPTDLDALGIAADMLQASRFPLIIAGRGAMYADAYNAIAELGSLVGALMGTTLPIHGYFADEDYDVGLVGGFATPLLVELAQRVDTVIVFGASLHPRTTKSKTLFPADAKIIHCDADPAAIGALTTPDHAVLGDAKDVAQRLVDLLKAREVKAVGARTPETLSAIRNYSPRAAYVDAGRPGVVDPRSLVIELDRLLTPERTVIADGGHSSGWPSVYMSIPDAQAYLFSLGDYASIGLGMGMAIGGAVARADRVPVFFVGDGSLLMALGDLATVARYRLPMVVVVLNDQAYGSEVHASRAEGIPVALSQYQTPDFAAVARSLGLRGETVRSLEDLNRVANSLTDVQAPILLDCLVDPEVVGPWQAFHVKEMHAVS